MWSACVDVYQLLNWKMHGETLKHHKCSNFHLPITYTFWLTIAAIIRWYYNIKGNVRNRLLLNLPSYCCNITWWQPHCWPKQVVYVMNYLNVRALIVLYWLDNIRKHWLNNTTVCYLNLHQWYISKRYSWAINHGIYIKCEHLRSMLHYLQVTHPTVLHCVTGLATFTFITTAWFFFFFPLSMNTEGLSDLGMPAVYTES